MNNLITQNLEKLQDLPKQLSKLERNNKNRYSYKRSPIHRVGDYYPWTLVDRIAEAYVNKPFDDAFSYYCTKVPKYQQYKFLELFEETHRRWYDDYKVDEEGIIRKIIRDTPKQVHHFYSDDYESAWKDRITGHIISRGDYEFLERGYVWWMYRKRTPKVDLSRYDLVTIKGGKRNLQILKILHL